VTKPRCCGFAFPILPSRVAALCLMISCVAFAQEYYPNQQVRINDLPSLKAKSKDASDVLAASLQIIFRDEEICCGKDSALEDDVQRADPKSLKDVANRLQGRHLLSDGRPIMVSAEYFPAASVNSSSLITTLTEKHALLMEWNSHLYVAYGVVFDLTVDDTNGAKTFAIRKLLLLDSRFSDQRREVAFDRQTDDWGKVQDLLELKAALQ